MIPSKAWPGKFLFALVGALMFSLTPGRVTPWGWIEEPLTPQAAVYYVDPTGDDSNAGTAAHPWRTIQKAADTLVAGETVYIKAGTYHERVVPQNSGSAG